MCWNGSSARVYIIYQNESSVDANPSTNECSEMRERETQIKAVTTLLDNDNDNDNHNKVDNGNGHSRVTCFPEARRLDIYCKCMYQATNRFLSLQTLTREQQRAVELSSMMKRESELRANVANPVAAPSVSRPCTSNYAWKPIGRM